MPEAEGFAFCQLANGVEKAAALVALHEFFACSGLNGDVGHDLDIATAAVLALERDYGDVAGVEEASVGVEYSFVDAVGAAVAFGGF